MLPSTFSPQRNRDPESDSQRAKRLVAELRVGGSFVDAVQRFSPPSRPSRVQNGKVGSLKLEDMEAEVKAAVSALKAGEITDPIRQQDGYLIYRLDDRKPETVRKYEDPEVTSAIGRALTIERAGEAQRKYVERLKQEAYIFIKPEYIGRSLQN